MSVAVEKVRFYAPIAPYVRNILWDIPANAVASTCMSLKAIPAAISGKEVPTANLVKDSDKLAPWLGQHIHDGLSSFFHGGTKACLEAREFFSKTVRGAGGKISLDAVSGSIGKLGGKGAIFAAGFLALAGILGFKGIKIMKGEHKILQNMADGMPGDLVSSKPLHSALFAAGAALTIGGLGSILAPSIAVAAFPIAIAAYLGHLGLDFTRWLIGGSHWGNSKMSRPLWARPLFTGADYFLRP